MPIIPPSRTPRPPSRRHPLVAVLLLVALAGPACVSTPDSGAWHEDVPAPSQDGPGDPTRARLALDVAVRDLPKSPIGNAPHYTVFDQRYMVLDSAAGFRERGTASWYGAKFHGRDTSSGEPYDMHLMSAAHKHLPLPTFVRVTREDTGRSVVVKVNDRGPFVDDRIIDLSYAAAARLDMLDSGTAPVTLEALSTHLPGRPGPVGTLVTRVREAAPPVTSAHQEQWIQIGAFSDQDNARQTLRAAAGSTGLGGRIELDARDALYRVRLGPLGGPHELPGLTAALALAGVDSYTMIPVAH